LYLWHWPLLTFVSIIEDGEVSRLVIYAVILISIFLSWLTYILVEKPIRFKIKGNAVILFLYLMLLGLGFYGWQINNSRGYPLRQASVVQLGLTSLYSVLEDDTLLTKKNQCDKIFKTKNIGLFPCIADSQTPKFLVLGDSHSIPFAYAAMIFNQNDTLVLHIGGALPFINYLTYRPLRDNRELVLKTHDDFYSYMSQATLINSVEYVILASRGPVYFSGTGFGDELFDPVIQGFAVSPIAATAQKSSSKELFVEGYVELANFLFQKGKKVIFVVDVPEIGFDPRKCIKKPIQIIDKEVSKCVVPRSEVDIRQKEYRELIAEIKKRVPELMVYDPTPIFCDSENCYAKKDDLLLYYDDDHLNHLGTKILIDDFNKWLQQQNSYINQIAIRKH
jgi:hypothetical protein